MTACATECVPHARSGEMNTSVHPLPLAGSLPARYFVCGGGARLSSISLLARTRGTATAWASIREDLRTAEAAMVLQKGPPLVVSARKRIAESPTGEYVRDGCVHLTEHVFV